MWQYQYVQKNTHALQYLLQTHVTVARSNAKEPSNKIVVAIDSLLNYCWVISKFHQPAYLKDTYSEVLGFIFILLWNNTRSFCWHIKKKMWPCRIMLLHLVKCFRMFFWEEIVFHYSFCVNITLTHQYKDRFLKTKFLINKRFEMDVSFKREKKKLKTCIFKQ